MASTINASSTGGGGLITTGDASGELALQANSVTKATVTANGLSLASNSSINALNTFGFENRIINGNMAIDQRNGGASITPTDGQFPVDRFNIRLTQASKLTAQQNQGAVTPPAGFTNYLGVTSSSAYAVTASDNFNIVQIIEGYNIADLGFGTASAKTVNLSFWVRSSLTGTFGGALTNSALDRSYPFSYSIPSANTWTQISVTIAGDTSGTWLTTNGQGIRVWFGLGVGTTLSGPAGSWSSNYYNSATGAVSVVGTSGATFYITGVQLEAGSQATSFDFRSIGTELALCQRYYYLLSAATNINTFFHPVAGYTTTAAVGTVSFPQMLRTGPSLVTSGTASNYRVLMGGAFLTCSSVPTIDQTAPSSVSLIYTVASGMTVGYGGNSAANGSTSAILGFSAEL